MKVQAKWWLPLIGCQQSKNNTRNVEGEDPFLPMPTPTHRLMPALMELELVEKE
jgi:hypothetical protein